jgi:hypothetical protein
MVAIGAGAAQGRKTLSSGSWRGRTPLPGRPRCGHRQRCSTDPPVRTADEPKHLARSVPAPAGAGTVIFALSVGRLVAAAAAVVAVVVAVPLGTAAEAPGPSASAEPSGSRAFEPASDASPAPGHGAGRGPGHGAGRTARHGVLVPVRPTASQYRSRGSGRTAGPRTGGRTAAGPRGSRRAASPSRGRCRGAGGPAGGGRPSGRGVVGRPRPPAPLIIRERSIDGDGRSAGQAGATGRRYEDAAVKG